MVKSVKHQFFIPMKPALDHEFPVDFSWLSTSFSKCVSIWDSRIEAELAELEQLLEDYESFRLRCEGAAVTGNGGNGAGSWQKAWRGLASLDIFWYHFSWLFEFSARHLVLVDSGRLGFGSWKLPADSNGSFAQFCKIIWPWWNWKWCGTRLPCFVICFSRPIWKVMLWEQSDRLENHISCYCRRWGKVEFQFHNFKISWASRRGTTVKIQKLCAVCCHCSILAEPFPHC